jgi:hypothetical protein
VCKRYSLQGIHQIYGHIRCIYTVLANLNILCTASGALQLVNASSAQHLVKVSSAMHCSPSMQIISYTHTHTHTHTHLVVVTTRLRAREAAEPANNMVRACVHMCAYPCFAPLCLQAVHLCVYTLSAVTFIFRACAHPRFIVRIC